MSEQHELALNGVHIYQFWDDVVWWAGTSPEQVYQADYALTGTYPDELPHQLSEEEARLLTVHDSEGDFGPAGHAYSFAHMTALMLSHGEPLPFMVAMEEG